MYNCVLFGELTQEQKEKRDAEMVKEYRGEALALMNKIQSGDK